MSMTSRFLLGVGLALVLLACTVDAHGWMSYPKPRGQYTSPPKPSYMEYAPATTDPNSADIVCRNDPVMPKDSWLELRAGQAQKITLEFNALHVGDCFVYLTYDGDKPQNEMKWFKIWEQHACKNSNNYEIDIPSYLPSGDHVIFRWEWYALHVYPIVEYYSQCVDAKMTGSISALSAAAASALPSPQVSMPGHLPKLSGNYADNSNNYWWPWDTQTMFFTGPKLATPGGQSPTTGVSTPKPPATPAPPATPKPPATPAPPATPKPPATPAPPATPRPPATPAPPATPKPPATPRPPATPAPPATPKPPVTQPTEKPVVNPPPAQSVKLNVLEASSKWWLATSVSGHRSNEVVKVEFKDSGAYNTFTAMENSWAMATEKGTADVYVFSPEVELSFPVVVKASLRSGSSLSFVINGLPATIVDSGAVFP